MFLPTTSNRGRAWLALFLLLLRMGSVACQAAAQAPSTEPAATQSDSVSDKDKASPQPTDAGLPLTFARQTGDLDAMVKRGSIRALVLYSRSGFFYVDGKPEGIYYEAMQYFERFLNEKLHTQQHVQVTFIPVRPDQLEAALTEGVGDLIAYGLAVTPEREQEVAFSLPIQTDVKQIVVTRKDFGPLSSLSRTWREKSLR